MQRLLSGVLVASAARAPIMMAPAVDSARLALTGIAPDLALAGCIAGDLRLAGEADSAGGSIFSLLEAQAATGRMARPDDQRRAHLETFGGDARWLRASVDFVLERRA